MTYQVRHNGTVINRATTAEGQVEGPPQAGQEPSAGEGMDLEALAGKVFALLKRELRLERERLGRSRA